MPSFYKRRCRKCLKWSTLAIAAEVCPKCRAPYGRWAVGDDLEVNVEKGKR